MLRVKLSWGSARVWENAFQLYLFGKTQVVELAGISGDRLQLRVHFKFLLPHLFWGQLCSIKQTNYNSTVPLILSLPSNICESWPEPEPESEHAQQHVSENFAVHLQNGLSHSSEPTHWDRTSLHHFLIPGVCCSSFSAFSHVCGSHVWCPIVLHLIWYFSENVIESFHICNLAVLYVKNANLWLV